MKDPSGTNRELLKENSALKQRIEELEHSESERKHAEQEIALIAEIERVVGSTLDINQVYERVATETRKLIPYDRLVVNRKIMQDGQFIVAYVSGIDNPRWREGDLYPIEGSATGVVTNTRTGILIQPMDAEEIKVVYPNLYITFKTGLRSTMGVPLISMDEVIGSLNFRSKKLKAYTEQDLRLAERIGMQVAGAIANAQLFDDLSKTEKSLRESEKKYREIFETITDVFYRMDIEGLLLIVSPSVERLLGYVPDEVIGKKLGEFFVNPEDRDQFLSVLQEKGEAKGFETPVRAKDGSVVWVSTNAHFYRDKQGKTLGIQGISRDITDRRRAEETLQKTNLKLFAIIDNLPFLAWLKDSEGRFMAVNEPFARSCGLSSTNDLVGKTDLDIWPKPLAEAYRADDFEVMRSRQKKAVEELISDQGVQKWFETYKAPLYEANGNVIGTTGFSRDITERKQAEEQIQQILESLRRAVGTTIQVMVSAVEVRDPYTSGHQLRSADLARAIATEMGLPQDKIEAIRMAGSIHDIGKLSIPAEILSKPTKLSAIEFSLIKAHAQKGFEMLKDVESPWPLAEIVYQHHERMDGSGYPRNLKGEEILIEARILSVADVVEAMASHRPYRPGLGIDAALNEIEKNRGIFYDDAVADACRRLFREKGYKLEGT